MSLARTNVVTLVLRFVVFESSIATGASFTHVMVNEPVAVFEREPDASTAW